MSEYFNMYPVLSDQTVRKLVPEAVSRSFSYFDDEEEYGLDLKNKTDDKSDFSAELNDPRCIWAPETHGLILHGKVRINEPECLFGEKGVVCRNATIGIAEQWISVKSDMRGTIPVGEFSIASGTTEFEYMHRFEKSILKGSVVIQLVFYLKKSGIANEGEKHLCNYTGTILGITDVCQIYIDGSGSLFPVASVYEPGGPLWSVYYDETADPFQDMFDSEHVEIRLNEAHPNYKQLKIETSLKESPLFLEVISTSLLIIIESAKEALGPDWNSVVDGTVEIKEGTIAEAIRYFVMKLGWDISGPNHLSQSIHRFFDENLKGGQLS